VGGGVNANLTIGENLTVFGLVDFIQGRTWINADIRGANHSFFNTRGVVEGVDPSSCPIWRWARMAGPRPAS
jgi:hypothetical protein